MTISIAAAGRAVLGSLTRMRHSLGRLALQGGSPT